MKVLFWIVGLPLLLVAGFFAVANREPVAISLWPFAEPFQVPLFIAVIVPLYVGVALGAVIAWASGYRARARGRTEARRAGALLRENEALKARLAAADAGRAADIVAPAKAAPVPFLQ